MKKLGKMIGIAVFTAAILFGAVSCGEDEDDGNGTGNTAGGGGINGTWVTTTTVTNSDTGEVFFSLTEKYNFSNGVFTQSTGSTEMSRGNYSLGNGTIAMTTNQVKGILLGGTGFGFTSGQWYTKAQARLVMVQSVLDLVPDSGMTDAEAQATADQLLDALFETTNYAYSISGNTLTLTQAGGTPMVYTRQ